MLQNDDVMVINQDCKIASDQETTPELFPVSAETSKQRYHQLVELFPDAVMILHDELCTYVNEAAMALFRAEDRNELLNKPLLGMVQTSEWEAFHQRVLRIQLEGGVFRSEERLLRLDGTLADIEIAITTFRDEQGQQALQVAAHDITERKRTQEQVHFLAYYDQLTNLPNRMQLYERLKCLFNECAEKCSSVALLVLDIHNLHEINTVYGDHIGDLVLEEVAARLVANCRSCDVISRYGNDEFIIALPDVELDDAVSIAKNMCGEIAQPFEVEQLELLVSCHQGLAIWHAGDDFESESFVQQAILALHEAKTHDNWLSIFNSRMADTLSQRRTIEYNLHQALDHTKQLLIYFQPQMHLCTRELIGIEALVRWRHPEWGLVTPGQFIPIAEQTGLIEKLDDFVMRSATRLNHQCVASDGRPLRVACNLSVRQFRRPDLVEVVRDVVATSGIQPENFELEITESAVMENVDRALSTLTQLCDLGVKIAIDDFGTGYSSLSYLTRFPVHTIKIDQSFVRNISTSKNDQAVIHTIVTLAHTLKMGVLAEGVETPEQLSFLKQIGCDSIQGYLLSRPIPSQEFIANVAAYENMVNTTLAQIISKI